MKFRHYNVLKKSECQYKLIKMQLEVRMFILNTNSSKNSTLFQLFWKKCQNSEQIILHKFIKLIKKMSLNGRIYKQKNNNE